MPPSPIHENKWKELIQTGKFTTFQNMTSVHDPLPMVQKLLDEEREAVKTALNAVDEHTRIKRKELAEAHRRWMNENKPANDGGCTKRTKPKSRNGHRRRLEQYEQYLHYSEKKRSVYLDVICEEDDEQHHPQPQRCSTSHCRREKPPIRLSSKNDDLALEERETSVLPPIDPNWRQRESVGKHDRAKLKSWQTVADNFIDSDARKRTRLRISGKTNQTQLHLNYYNNDGSSRSERKGGDNEFRLQKKRQYHNGPAHSSSNSRWISNIPSLAPGSD